MNLKIDWKFISANRMEELVIWLRKNSIPHTITNDYIGLYSEEDMVLFKLKFKL